MDREQFLEQILPPVAAGITSANMNFARGICLSL